MRRYKRPYRVKKKKVILSGHFFRVAVLLLIFFISFFYLWFFTDILLVKKAIFSQEEDFLVRQPAAVAVWCGQECFLADKNGMIFKKALAETDLIKIFGKKELLISQINWILEIESKLKEDLGIRIEKADLVSFQRLNAQTSEGWAIYFDLSGDLDWQITKLGLVLEKQIPPEKRGSLEYIDLRFSRIYYKYR